MSNLTCVIWEIFKLAFIHAPSDFLDLDNLARTNGAWLEKDLEVSYLQAMPG